jgi:3-phenylpropionate/trans-cinnamate dioxygenase ferredoxin subunit
MDPDVAFVPVCKATDLAEPGRMLVEVDQRLVALFRVQGQFFAIDDVCTHDGGPLADGALDGYTIACPRHGAKFDIRDGRALSMPATHNTVAHEVKVLGDQVLIRLRDDDR